MSRERIFIISLLSYVSLEALAQTYGLRYANKDLAAVVYLLTGYSLDYFR